MTSVWAPVKPKSSVGTAACSRGSCDVACAAMKSGVARPNCASQPATPSSSSAMPPAHAAYASTVERSACASGHSARASHSTKPAVS